MQLNKSQVITSKLFLLVMDSVVSKSLILSIIRYVFFALYWTHVP